MTGPVLWVVGGPNGAGKSTLADRHLGPRMPVVSPDTIAAVTGVTPLEAGKAAIREQERLLAAQAVFAVDTTFSGKREVDFVRRAKGAGYRVFLLFVGVEGPGDCVRRITERVASGGHDVPTADVVRRYGRCLLNLALVAPLVDRLYVFDNSRRARRLVLAGESGKPLQVAPDPPRWLPESLGGWLRGEPDREG